MERDLFWIWLMSLTDLGNKRKLKLLEYFETPEKIYNADEKSLMASGAVKEKDCKYIRSQQHLYLATKARGFMERHRIDLITIENSLYPARLKNIYDPPVGLFAKGNLDLLDRPMYLGIVGSRKASPAGLKQTRKLAETFSDMGITIVSGLAEGVDGESHLGSCERIGSTIAVMGTGINVCYPEKHKPLYKKIVRSGLILTEFFMDEPPLKFHFPRRNRIISDLCDGLLVVEAREKSGALITADFALEQGKNVYAVPGDIARYQSVGSNQLIKEGAKVVTEPEDVLEDYVDMLPQDTESFHNPISLERAAEGIDDPEQKKILNYVAEGYTTVDELVGVSGMGIGAVNGALSMLELDDRVKVEYGKVYIL